MDNAIFGTKSKLMFEHIPKNAGTAIEVTAKLSNNILWGWQLMRANDKTKLLWKKIGKELCDKMKTCHNALWHIPIRIWIKYFSNYNYKSKPGELNISSYFDLNKVDYFCIVRDPFDKFISEFKYLMKIGKDIPLGHILLKKHNITINNKDECNEFSLNLWIVNAIKEYIKLNNYCQRGCHFVKQYDYVYDENHKQICKHVLHFENLTKEFSVLMDQYNLNNISQSLPNNKITHSSHCQNVHFSKANLTNITKQLIYEHYQQDFTSFGYHYH